jgi:hypothetical protein
MNIVFAYHNGDAELALLSAKAITSFGINMRHKATVCATNDSALLFDIIEELKKSFPEVGRIIAQDGFNGWPLGPNQMFSDAAAQCYSVNEPWMFWEPDCVPMKQGWADDLEAEFRKEPAILGHQYEGGMATNGKNIYKMIVGSAIYPPNFLDFCPSARSLDNYNLAYRSAGSIPEPWDVRCRWNFMAIGRDCPLMRTYWRSVNYQWKDGKIVFFAEDPESQAIQGVTCPDRVISSKAVVIHGCKDGSLHKMAIAGFPMPEDKPVMPSDSTGLDIPSNSMGLESIPDQEQAFSNVSVGDEIEIVHIPVREPDISLQEVTQNVDTCLQGTTVCNKTSEEANYAPYPIQVLCEAVGITTREKKMRAIKQDPPKKKKKRMLSSEERQRRSEAMKAILARKAERKAQGVV